MKNRTIALLATTIISILTAGQAAMARDYGDSYDSQGNLVDIPIAIVESSNMNRVNYSIQDTRDEASFKTDGDSYDSKGNLVDVPIENK